VTGYSLAPIDRRYLVRHWGSAYKISGDCRTAVRRDNGQSVTAETPVGLRDAIRADYQAREVPRDSTRRGAHGRVYPVG
jgi:hypothetical protein